MSALQANRKPFSSVAVVIEAFQCNYTGNYVSTFMYLLMILWAFLVVNVGKFGCDFVIHLKSVKTGIVQGIDKTANEHKSSNKTNCS